MNPDDLAVNLTVDDSKFKACLADFMQRMDDYLWKNMMIPQHALGARVITSADTAGAVWPTIPVVASIGGTNWTLGGMVMDEELFYRTGEVRYLDVDEVPHEEPEPVRRRAIALRGITIGG